MFFKVNSDRVIGTRGTSQETALDLTLDDEPSATSAKTRTRITVSFVSPLENIQLN